MNFRDSAIAQLQLLHRLVELEQKELDKMPPGKMVKKISKGRVYYYVEEGETLISLFDTPDKRKQYIKKEQLTKRIRDAKSDIISLEKLLKRYHPIIGTDVEWDNIEPARDSYREEDRIHCYEGTYYRSKSEVLIATVLNSYNIEFKYETRIEINGKTHLTDFHIKRPRDKKLFIWEHLGMVGDERYLKRTFDKLQDYHYGGYDIWDNLIISFDQEDGSIDIDVIDKIIKTFLL